jgi:phosphopantetheinyl transferase (holo-ACP synthase)
MAEINGGNGGRTHEPALRELVAQIDGMVKLYEERDRRYEDRFKSQEVNVISALASADKQNASAFAAAKEAVLKSENSQTSYNATHNDITRKMDNQYLTMLPRTEADARFKGLEEKFEDAKKDIATLREFRSVNQSGRENTRWLVPVAVTGFVGFLGFLAMIGIAAVKLFIGVH